MSIPIIINNRNRLTTTRKMVENLNKLGYTNIYILDNDSSYEPLLEWYKDCPATVIYLNRNIGHTALWDSGVLLNQFKDNQYVAYTDSDIEINSKVEPGFIEEFTRILKDFRAEKVGFAIRYKDIPRSLANDRSRMIEERYWSKRIPHPKYELYETYIDTTFAVIKTNSTYSWAHRAFRVAGDYICKHMPWYLDYNNLSEEEQYVLDHADPAYCSYKKLMQS